MIFVKAAATMDPHIAATVMQSFAVFETGSMNATAAGIIVQARPYAAAGRRSMVSFAAYEPAMKAPSRPATPTIPSLNGSHRHAGIAG